MDSEELLEVVTGIEEYISNYLLDAHTLVLLHSMLIQRACLLDIDCNSKKPKKYSIAID